MPYCRINDYFLSIHHSIKTKHGAFSVNGTGKPFSRVAVDMTLEQTINVEAKIHLKGVMAFPNIILAVNRWQVTNGMKTKIIRSLLEMAEIKNYNAEMKELNHPRIERNHQDMQALTNITTYTINPYLPMVNQNSLINLKTSKNASKTAEAFLLTMFEKGNSKRDT